ncbi:endo alpha-1,4 polygalactosaminidase [Embleya scabrispora]|uniref:endo alpha-1,4 polygalactosaminidase n=1 Tax=Embleya scabrispora TaxID=159449 RepID=UPI00037BEDD8|nr:endo alpha-1,4 polygalactosaminidase [Embleya scabrispora]
MNTFLPRRSARRLAAVTATTAAIAGTLFLTASADASSDPDSNTEASSRAGANASTNAAAITLPPTHANFDYQIGGAYTPPAGVKVVTRDHGATPAPGLYNICYVNAFQAQPKAEGDWPADLLLRRGDGSIVYDGQWKEALLDLRTADKRTAVARKVDALIDECASKGFQAVEPDNYDSYTRSEGLLTGTNAQDYIALLAAHAHQRGLAIAQKNTAELAANRKALGLDFAVAEECGQWKECGDYTEHFGNDVIVIEYTAKGLSNACSKWGDKLSIVRRDLGVSPVGDGKYVRKTC